MDGKSSILVVDDEAAVAHNALDIQQHEFAARAAASCSRIEVRGMAIRSFGVSFFVSIRPDSWCWSC